MAVMLGCKDDSGPGADRSEAQLKDFNTGETVDLSDADGEERRVDVFFAFPVETVFDFFPGDVTCRFSAGLDVVDEVRPGEVRVEEHGGREVTPIATFFIVGGDGEMTCVDHVQRAIDLSARVVAQD